MLPSSWPVWLCNSLMPGTLRQVHGPASDVCSEDSCGLKYNTQACLDILYLRNTVSLNSQQGWEVAMRLGFWCHY